MPLNQPSIAKEQQPPSFAEFFTPADTNDNRKQLYGLAAEFLNNADLPQGLAITTRPDQQTMTIHAEIPNQGDIRWMAILTIQLRNNADAFAPAGYSYHFHHKTSLLMLQTEQGEAQMNWLLAQTQQHLQRAVMYQTP